MVSQKHLLQKFSKNFLASLFLLPLRGLAPNVLGLGRQFRFRFLLRRPLLLRLGVFRRTTTAAVGITVFTSLLELLLPVFLLPLLSRDFLALVVVVELVGAFETQAGLHERVLLLRSLDVRKVDLPGAELAHSVALFVAAHKLSLGQNHFLFGAPAHTDLVFFIPRTTRVYTSSLGLEYGTYGYSVQAPSVCETHFFAGFRSIFN